MPEQKETIFELKQDPEVLNILERMNERKSDDGTVWLNMFMAFASKESLSFLEYDENYIAGIAASFADAGLEIFNERFNK